MIGVTMLPLILLLMHRGFARMRAGWIIAAGVLTGLLAATSYIVTWFFLLHRRRRGGDRPVAIADFRAAFRAGHAPRPRRRLLGLVVGLIPFALIYGPMIATGERRIATT